MPNKPDSSLLENLIEFTQPLVSSRDIDPVYPVLAYSIQRLGLEEERALWLTALYLAYYNLPSALQAFWLVEDYRADFPHQLVNFPCAVERRGNRGGRILEHLKSYVEAVTWAGSQRAFVQRNWGDDPVKNYEAFWFTAQTIHQNGRWAAFKWAELLKTVHGMHLAAPDMRMEFCTGPKHGLEMLYRHPRATLSALKYYELDLSLRLSVRGLDLSWEELETALCNFHSLVKGRYYVGHDIDELLVQARECQSLRALNLILEARRAVLPEKYLAEVTGDVPETRLRTHKQLFSQRGVIWVA